jgi:hypothetical protein
MRDVWRHAAHRALATLAVLALLPAAACELQTATVPRAEPVLLVHGVLDPALGEQVVLVERGLAGQRPAVTVDYDSRDPIRTSGGDPVNGAAVVITDSAAFRLVLSERMFNGRPTGVYAGNITSPAQPLVSGRVYYLSVRTAEDEVVTGRTRMPEIAAAPVTTISGFNRDTDTLRLGWVSRRWTRAYWVRVSTPQGPLTIPGTTNSVAIAGTIRNIAEDFGARAFLPGLVQRVTVAAVDSNLYDYERTGNDPFTGGGLINRLQGGIGVFGAVTDVLRRNVDVTATRRDPFEGVYTRTAGTSTLRELHLWIESVSDGVPRLSGYIILGSTTRYAVLGDRRGDAVSLRVLDESAPIRTITAQVQGNTLVATGTLAGVVLTRQP